MGKFIKKALLCLFLALFAFAAVRTYTISYRVKNFSSTMVDKLEMLAKNKHRRKIILIGGSSVGFGISAQMIEQQTGIKTINLGQYAGLGLVEFQDFILKNLNKEDIVIFSPEWLFYQDPTFTDQGELDNLINNNMKYGYVVGNPFYEIRSFFSSISMFEFSRASMENQLKRAVPPYVYDCINTNGDIIAHCDLKRGLIKRYDLKLQLFSIQRFIHAFPVLHRPNTIVVFPPTQQIVYNGHKSDFKNIERQFKIHKIVFIDPVASNVYNDSDFFDREYHLTCAARATRTDTIVNYLKANLSRLSMARNGIVTPN